MAKITQFAESIDLKQFLASFPHMTIVPGGTDGLLLEGEFEFQATTQKHGVVDDSFRLRIRIPECFPKAIPQVYELGGRIPRNGNYHVNGDYSFCLGSRIRLLILISQAPTLLGFVETCLIPYLYAVSIKLSRGGAFVLGELPHGTAGELSDYAAILGLDSKNAVLLAIKYLGMKKRRANKLTCPCGCKDKLGRCRFNRKLRDLRLLTSRSWYRMLLTELT